MQERFYTLLFVRDGDEILLGKKKRGFGKGKWNGFGGKIEKDESKFESAQRELKEECGLSVNEENLKYLGYVSYLDESQNEQRIVYIFFVNKFKGKVEESDEMMPKWFRINNVPYQEMWEDCKYWLPRVLKEKYFVAKFVYGINSDILFQNVTDLKNTKDYVSESK